MAQNWSVFLKHKILKNQWTDFIIVKFQNFDFLIVPYFCRINSGTIFYMSQKCIPMVCIPMVCSLICGVYGWHFQHSLNWWVFLSIYSGISLISQPWRHIGVTYSKRPWYSVYPKISTLLFHHHRVSKSFYISNAGSYVVLVSLFGRPIVRSISHFFGSAKTKLSILRDGPFLSTLLNFLSSLFWKFVTL